MKTIIDVASQAAIAAGSFIQESANNLSLLTIEQKSRHDYVSEVDRGAEQIVIDHIHAEFPDHHILGEELGFQGDSSSEYQWIIDPLDGTTNFLRSIAHYAVSIAVLRDNVVEHAAVYDPAKKELFTASRGQGAFLNDKPISVSNLTVVKSGLYATGIPFSDKNLAKIDAFTDTVARLLEMHTSGIRRLGAAALDLAYVAAGRYDGFWEPNLQKWDIAAGVLLVEEAGGKVSDFNGLSQYLENGDVVAAPLGVHEGMLSIVNDCYHDYL